MSLLEDQCFKGTHDLRDIFSLQSEYNGDRIVRWCKTCGAIVVDIEVDGRLMGNELKMMAPLITREALAKHSERK